MAKKRKRNGMVSAALDVAGGGVALGITTDVVGRVPHGGPGAAALATGASFMPTYATARIGGELIREVRKVGNQKKKRRCWLY